MYLTMKITAKIFLLAYLSVWVDATNDLQENNQPDIGPMNFTQLCDTFGLNCEQHEVTTEDGYILTVYHVVGNKTRPVLLWHGIVDSSDTFLIRGPNSTCAALAAAGFDVWLGNSRGNKYSRRHTYLDPDKDKLKYWDFSFYEMGYYDLAATIDYILESPGQKKLSAIGHSQGNTIFFVLASTRPIYNEKVKFFIALAPIAFLVNVDFEIISPLWSTVSPVLALTNTYNVLQDENFVQKLCSQEIAASLICDPLLYQPLVGRDPEELEPEFLQVVSQHFPVGTSKKDVDHFIQLYNRKHFANSDYGFLKNLKKYNAISPPNYDLKNVNTSVALLCGANDNLSTLADVKLLRDELPNIVLYKVMDRKKFNHLDFVWGKHINVYLNPLLEKLLRKYA